MCMTMSKNVIKYGGSNLREPKGVSQLVGILDEYSDPVLVVSALFGVTDFIQDFLQIKKITKKQIQRFTDLLYKKHSQFVFQLTTNSTDQKRINKLIKTRILELEHILLGIYYLGELPLHLQNLILSYGERLSALLISQVIQLHKPSCSEALPENIGLIAKGEPSNASIDLQASVANIRKSLSGQTIYVIPGFYAPAINGRISLLGRGGTDYAAACIAFCLEATSLDIWKDVVGFQSSDPTFVKEAILLESLTYDEAAELAYFGARILHPRTVEPLVEKNIPIRIFSTALESGTPSTIINGKKHIREDIIKSITFSDDFAVLKLSGPGVGIKPGVLAKVTTLLHDQGINISSVITSQIAINLIISRTEAEQAKALIIGLELPVIKSISLLKNVTLLALVGHGMVDQHGVAARTFTVLAKNSINVHLSSMGASDVTTYLIINQEDKQKALEEIHREFFERSQLRQIKKAG